MTQALILSRPRAELARAVAQLRLRGAALWRAYPRETIGAGMLGLVGLVSLGVAVGTAPNRVEAAPPAPPLLIIRDLAPQQAVAVNAEIPVAQGPNPAAAPFRFKGDKAARGQALECLASAVYYEAGSQDDNGERAVAQVILNRVRHPAFPASVCGVVYQGSTRSTGCQFTFTCDGSLYRQPDAAGWRRAYGVARAALGGSVYAPVGWATHYHANYVVPYWASSLAKNAIVGAHIFYHWAGEWGQPAIFSKAYAGREPNALGLRNAALAAEVATGGEKETVAAAIEQIPGAEVIKLAPSMRGDKRVAVRFNLTARKASEEAAHVDYVRKFEASDNLKYALSDDAASADQKPLGKAPDPASPATGAAPGAARP
ncbi:MAG TPA: cell wall hydrolase [Sphingomicrobium sp.]|nr:cell wall hydrolase [Sphingomicrobium sp.]